MNCKYCNKEQKPLGLSAHQRYCKSNPNRLSRSGVNNPNYGKAGKNAYSKAAEDGIAYIPSDAVLAGRKKTSQAMNEKRWSQPEARQKQSDAIKAAIERNPAAYSTANVSGRAKCYPALDSYGNETWLKGTWEVIVAEWLTTNGYTWTNKIQGIPYVWKGSTHLYYPDFFVVELNRFIEVKGYERERDTAKWSAVSDLIVLKKDAIASINSGTFKLE